MSSVELVLGAIIAALTVIGAQVSLFLPAVSAVPLTFQVVGVAVAGMALRPRAAFMSMLSYVVLGLVGVPVFARLQGGPGIVLGPTGGFIISMPLAAAAVSYAMGRLPPSRGATLWAGLAAIPVMYALGSLQLSVVLGVSWGTALSTTLVFLPFDILKIGLAAIIVNLLRRWSPH